MKNNVNFLLLFSIFFLFVFLSFFSEREGFLTVLSVFSVQFSKTLKPALFLCMFAREYACPCGYTSVQGVSAYVAGAQGSLKSALVSFLWFHTP